MTRCGFFKIYMFDVNLQRMSPRQLPQTDLTELLLSQGNKMASPKQTSVVLILLCVYACVRLCASLELNKNLNKF